MTGKVSNEDGSIPKAYAEEMAQVGAIVSYDAEVGDVMDLGGVPAAITSKITRAQFLEMVTVAGMDADGFVDLPDDIGFYTISVD